MEKKFGFLRFIGTMWKVIAWIVLVVGILASIGALLVNILGGGLMGSMMSQFGQDYGWSGGMPVALSVVSGVVGFIFGLILTLIYFVVLYAVGELIFLLLAIEENTRETTLWMRTWGASAGQQQMLPPA